MSISLDPAGDSFFAALPMWMRGPGMRMVATDQVVNVIEKR
jgi:hypothetical protein